LDKNIKYGEIYYANLNPVIGSEQGGIRPVLIISNDIGNKYSPTVITAAITSRKKASQPTHVKINDVQGLPKDSIVLMEQIRTLDKQRLQGYIGKIDRPTLQKIEKAAHISLRSHYKEDSDKEA